MLFAAAAPLEILDFANLRLQGTATRETSGSRPKTNKSSKPTEPLLSHLSSEGAECWLGSAGRGSLCVCPCIIFRAGYQPCQHENKPVTAKAFSHDATSANSGEKAQTGFCDSSRTVFPLLSFYVCSVCFEPELNQLERTIRSSQSVLWLVSFHVLFFLCTANIVLQLPNVLTVYIYLELVLYFFLVLFLLYGYK